MLSFVRRSVVSGVLGSVVLAGSALPQGGTGMPTGFNVDLGQLNGTPAATFGGAAQQPGYWVSMSALDFCTWIFDIDHAVTLFYHLYSTGTAGRAPYPGFHGDEASMMEDFHVLDPNGSQTRLYLIGLQPGVYDAYVYSWSWNDPFAVVETWMAGPVVHAPVSIHGSDWPGQHVEGMTYSRMSFEVGDTPIEIYARNISGSGVINGVQIVRVDEVGTSFCTSSPNSTGEPATIQAIGRTGISANELTLRAGPFAPAQPAIFYYGQNEAEVPFGNGTRCVGGPVYRLYPFAVSDATGYASSQLDLAHPVTEVHWAPFSTWKFQAWFRDPAGGESGFDLSNGVSVTFTP